MPDHFWVNDMDCFECWTTLTYFAGLYPSLTFGSIVLCHSFSESRASSEDGGDVAVPD
jgi:hypothetical protein